eukprot:362089-Chlamydomonas_euryale.AAC.5
MAGMAASPSFSARWWLSASHSVPCARMVENMNEPRHGSCAVILPASLRISNHSGQRAGSPVQANGATSSSRRKGHAAASSRSASPRGTTKL